VDQGFPVRDIGVGQIFVCCWFPCHHMDRFDYTS
jgi:hypothetical protein